AVIFHPDENGRLAPAGRLRSQQSSAKIESDRNATWREGVKLCERAEKSGEILTAIRETEGVATSFATSVAVPLRHERRAVGALLLRLREAFDESDRPRLGAVGAQLARSFQRDEARKQLD